MKIKGNYPALIILGLLLVFTTTLGGASTINWSEPLNLSDWHPAFSEPWLLQGAEGTQALLWIHYDINPNMDSVQARVRQPSGEWIPTESVFGAVEEYYGDPEFAAAPDGTFWALWALVDKTHPGDDILVVAASWTGNGPWQSEAISDYETTVRDIDLSIGPDGHIAATWVACATTTSDDEGPCDVRVRRRNPGVSSWEARDESLDAAVTGIIDARSLVGHEGLIVTTWGEYSQTTQYEWHIMSSAFDPGLKTWDFPPVDISGGGFFPGQDPFLAEPVMGSDNTVIIGWYIWQASQPTKSRLFSVTRQGGTAKWSLPVPLSDYQIPSVSNSLRFALGQDGTALAVWVEKRGSVSEYALYANQRDPGSTWLKNPVKVTNWINRIVLAEPQVWPDGSSLLLWKAVDNRRPVNESQSVFWSARPPKGNWGGLGSGQLGGWFKEVFSFSLAASDKGNVTAVWGIEDTSQPPGQYAGALAASWIPGNGDIPISTLTSGYHSIYFNNDGVVMSPDGGSKAAAWVARKDINNPNPTAVDAVFYAGAVNQIVLPLVVQSAP